MMANQLLFVFVLICLINMVIESYPGGTGSCIGGIAAVGGIHLEAGAKTITNTSLEEQNVALLLNQIVYAPNDIVFL